MTKKTEEKAEPKAEMSPELEAISGARHQLAKVLPIEKARLELFNPLNWTTDDIEVIKKTVCPAGIPDADFKLFIMKCQASGMNPLLGEAFCIKRNQNIGSKEHPKWVEVFQYTPGEQGMEGRADDFADYRGLRAAAVYENDKIVIDSSAGEVSHQWNPVDPKRGRLVGAWAMAYREGRKTPVEFVRIEEYIDLRNPKWASSPATMIVKCARAAALRRAYPNRFSGFFAREELPEDGDRVTGGEPLTGSQAEQLNRDTTDKLAERMKATGAAQTGLKAESRMPASQSTVTVTAGKSREVKLDPREAEAMQRLESAVGPDLAPKPDETMPEGSRPLEKSRPSPNELWTQAGGDAEKFKALMTEHGHLVKASEVEKAKPPADPEHRDPVVVTEKLPHEVADEKKAAEAAKGPLMNFGEFKGKPIASLDGPQLHSQVLFGESKIGTLDAAKAAKVRACIDAIKAEQKRRDDALLEPGADLDVD